MIGNADGVNREGRHKAFLSSVSYFNTYGASRLEACSRSLTDIHEARVEIAPVQLDHVDAPVCIGARVVDVVAKCTRVTRACLEARILVDAKLQAPRMYLEERTSGEPRSNVLLVETKFVGELSNRTPYWKHLIGLNTQ